MSLKSRLTILSALTVTAAVTIFASVAIVRSRNVLETRTVEELKVLSHGLAAPARQQLTRTSDGKKPMQWRQFQSFATVDTNISYAVLVLPGGDTLPLPALHPTGSVVPEPPADLFRRRDGETFEVQAADGTRFSAMASKVKDSDAVMFVALADERTAASVSELIRTYELTGLALVAGFIAVTAVVVRLALRPLSSLTEAANRINAGEQDPVLPEGRPCTEVGDLTEALNKTLTELDRMAASTKAFAADAAHELRTPITTIIGYAELFHSGALSSPSDVDAAFGRIHHESRRMAELTDGLLLINQIEARMARGEVSHREVFDVVELVAEAAADSMATSPEHPVELVFPSRIEVALHRDRLFQVVSNVLANVRQHTPAGTSTLVEIGQAEHGSLTLRFTDDGPGLPEGFAEVAFDRFTQADGARPGEGPAGSGLGLSIVKALVSELGGTVSIGGVPGGGTSVVVTFPIAKH